MYELTLQDLYTNCNSHCKIISTERVNKDLMSRYTKRWETSKSSYALTKNENLGIVINKKY